ncbi:MAG: SPOR domain-containing protein [Porticoccaceae bacterium]|nr:SPOR domain-containing protein [Porticoccaceae bacterium]
MNKATHLQANPANRTTRDSKVNQNLSPSLARIRNRSATAPTRQETSPEKSRATSPAGQPGPARPAPAQPQRPTSGNRKILQTPGPTAINDSQTGANSARMVPWLIASITLTLALFSGNYAWHTQQQVEKMNLRLGELEAVPAINAGYLPETSEQLAKTNDELRNLKAAQEQLANTLATLQGQITNSKELASSRLVTLENELASLASLMQNVAAPESGPSQTELLAQTVEIEANKEAVSDDKMKSAQETRDAREYWFINIASFSDRSAANNSYAKVLKIADKASIKPLTINGKTLYRIRAEGYSSQQAAEGAAQVLQTQLGLSGLWISRD